MVLSIPSEDWNKLTHKERRTLINKEKKRRLRQAAALLREQEQETDSEEGLEEEEEEEEEEKRRKEVAERQLQHEAWLHREKLAQEKFWRRRKEEEKKLKEREEREQFIREEWERMEEREKATEKKQEKAKRDKEVLLQEALSAIDSTMKESGMQLWHNPLAPDSHETESTASLATTVDSSQAHDSQSGNYGTEKDVVNCPFYLKVGACRFGDRCSRRHPVPASSTTLLIRGMFTHLELQGQLIHDQQDQDLSLEQDDDELRQKFVEFYEDVLPEFQKHGQVIQFKVSCNYETHLRGNVFVQYRREEECASALRLFNGRWYAGRQISCEFSPVQRWRTAICGLYDRRKCPKGKNCNFLHVFENPGGSFSWADRDLPSPLFESSDRKRYPSRGSLSEDHSEYHSRSSSSRSEHGSRRRHKRQENRSRSRERSRDRDKGHIDSDDETNHRHSSLRKKHRHLHDKKKSHDIDQRSSILKKKERSHCHHRKRLRGFNKGNKKKYSHSTLPQGTSSEGAALDQTATNETLGCECYESMLM